MARKGDKVPIYQLKVPTGCLSSFTYTQKLFYRHTDVQLIFYMKIT